MIGRYGTAAFAALMAIALAQPATADAQFGKLKEKVKQKVSEKVDKKIDCALGEIFKDGKCVKSAEAAKGSADEGGEGGSATAASSETAAKKAALKPGQGAWANFDFVPGERVIFYEDYSKDRIGNFPRRLELNSGLGEIVEWPEASGKRWLRFKADEDADGFNVNLPEVLPQRFTVEFDVVIPWSGFEIYIADQAQDQPYGYDHNRIRLLGHEVGAMRAGRDDKGSKVDPRNVFKDFFCEIDGVNVHQVSDCENNMEESRPFKARLHVDGNYVKFYLDEVRIANVPNLDMKRGKRIIFHFRPTYENMALIGPISVNAGGREMYDALMADGRLAIQGIYFDSGKDKIRPESSGTLQEIAAMLSEHSELKLTIEGHTDNVGDAAANQKLSEARAAAVVSALSAAPYNVGADRLKSIGFGSTKPAKPNETPEGRQANRRVELVVQK